MANIQKSWQRSSDREAYARVFGPPALSLSRRRGILHDVRPIKHGRGYLIRATVQLEGILVRGVLASSAGVAWPTRCGDPVIDFVDADLMARAERALMDAARQAGRRGA